MLRDKATLTETMLGTLLKPGDVVQAFDGAYGHATVKQIKGGEVHLFRPYVQTSDYETTAGVICTIGIENFSVPAYQSFELVRRR